MDWHEKTIFSPLQPRIIRPVEDAHRPSIPPSLHRTISTDPFIRRHSSAYRFIRPWKRREWAPCSPPGTLPALPRGLEIERTTRRGERRMAMQVRTSGCLFSIIASVVLTVLLNVMLRGCSGY
jgi:hypothetical protein